MILRQFLHTEPVIAASYLVGCGGRGVAAVIDPLQDSEPYLNAAEAHGMRIRYVIDTPVHADHLSGGPPLAVAAGAEYVLGRACGSPHVADDETIALGNVILRIMHAPGHTPEHVVVVVSDRTRGGEVWGAFTGHTLMVGDMGRTELAGDPLRGAADLFGTAERLRALPDHVLVLPGAFSGSVCGRGLSGNPVSTIGFERRWNRAFGMLDREEFVGHMVDSIPPPPPRAAETRAANLRAGATTSAPTLP